MKSLKQMFKFLKKQNSSSLIFLRSFYIIYFVKKLLRYLTNANPQEFCTFLAKAWGNHQITKPSIYKTRFSKNLISKSITQKFFYWRWKLPYQDPWIKVESFSIFNFPKNLESFICSTPIYLCLWLTSSFWLFCAFSTITSKYKKLYISDNIFCNFFMYIRYIIFYALMLDKTNLVFIEVNSISVNCIKMEQNEGAKCN